MTAPHTLPRAKITTFHDKGTLFHRIHWWGVNGYSSEAYKSIAEAEAKLKSVRRAATQLAGRR
ncbi:hypothetical protein [Flexibacterium corallicola]|uniref:hypothetical protein n=1 Tax=Flexibacterium corallicola TaxID=3037259 RepID=UPI00286EE0E3|nr:hypothetical protein [Pseudovibrio sp. M1P-2-3]